MKILFDTNFLISCVQRRVDFISESQRLFDTSEIIIPHEVFHELAVISQREGKSEDKRAAGLAYQIVQKAQQNSSISLSKPQSKSADDVLLSFDSDSAVIGTFDRELKKRFVYASFLRIKGQSLTRIEPRKDLKTHKRR